MKCSIDGCEKPVRCRGWCNKHHMRWYRTGNPLNAPDQRGERNPYWKGRAVGYFGAHSRVKYSRGSASAHECAHCDQTAREWAYDHADPDELVSESGSPYSPDPAHYVPLCRDCHGKFDSTHRKAIA